MEIAVFHGSPRRGNTYTATRIFMDELSTHDDIEFTEFRLPQALPEFCTGCQLCLSSPRENCPHSKYVDTILEAIIKADTLVFATPHFGACDMPAGLKTLFDHLDFLTLNVAPRPEIFKKKAFIISTAAGSTAAIKPIRNFLRNWGINRVRTLGLRMFTNEWNMMPEPKRKKFELKLRSAANRFYRLKTGVPHVSTLFMYYMSRFILKRYIGEGSYPYEHWRSMGYFAKRPF